MIRLTDVRKVYRTRSGDNVVLDGVGFELRRGERLGVLGRNGAGKSTMVRLISGAERPSAGRVERYMSVSWPLAFGGAFQPALSGIDNVRFISRIYAQDFERNLAFVSDFSELGAYLREPVRSYSSGMRARLAFAISMIIEFDCFLIDEIGAVGDARFHDRCNHELFGRRGDRAMVLISHDPGYLRDRCNRFALLHGGRLALFDEFDAAYSHFREAIGLAGAPAVDRSAVPDRASLIEMTQHRALGDERFRMLVREGDWRRDARDWAAARERYAAALALHPYQRSYWVQLGHVAKEGGQFARAELAYRTAGAMGEPAADIAEHLAFVVGRRGADPAASPIHPYRKGPAYLQVPGAPDVEALALLLWQGKTPDDEEAAALLRAHASCDSLAAAMVGDARFSAGEEHRDTLDWQALGEVVRVLALDHLDPDAADAVLAGLAGGGPAWPPVRDAGAFRDWPETQRALSR